MRFHKSVQHPLKIPRATKGTPKLCGFFVDHSGKFHVLSNSLQEIPHAIANFHPQSFPCLSKILFEFFYWNSMIQKDGWVMTSSE